MSVIFCFSSFSTFAGSDTLWTRFNYPWLISNAVFSPDGNYIYATGGYNTTRLYQYDLNGNLISQNDTVGGMKQFSQDGKYFYNFIGGKYEISTCKRVGGIGGWDGNNVRIYDINETADIGIATTQTDIGYVLDSNFIFFKPSNFEVIEYLTHPGTKYGENIWELNGISIAPNGSFAALFVSNRYNINQTAYGEEYVEIWDVSKRKLLKSLYSNPSKYSEKIKLQFSPDGKYLGISNERKLFLYSTIDWSLIHTFDYTQSVGGVTAFCFSKDNRKLYVAGDGIIKINLDTKIVDYTYYYAWESCFITESRDNSYLLSEANAGALLVLFDNTISGVEEEINPNIISISPNPAMDILNITITIETAQLLVYSISNLKGNPIIPNMKKELNSGINQFLVNVSELTNGVYLLNATLDGQSKSYKFVVER